MRHFRNAETEQDVLYHERGDTIPKSPKTESPERMTALLLRKLLQVIESNDPPDARTLRDCVAVLKELTALLKDLTPQTEDNAGTGVIILPEVLTEE